MNEDSSMQIMMSDQEHEAFTNVFAVARNRSGQSRRAADFLLACWNAEDCGKWAPMDLWAMDRTLARDMLIILSVLNRAHCYFDAFGYREQIDEIFAMWRKKKRSRKQAI